MLHIVPAREPLWIENLIVCIYGPPGVGKSSLGFTSEKPLNLDFDVGAHRARNRKDTVRIEAWTAIDSMTGADLAPFKTIVVDTAGRALDSLSLDIIQKNPKHGRGSGALSLSGFGELKSRFQAWMNLLRSFKKDVVLVCHMSEERNGDDLIERIDAQGSSRNEIYKSADAMGRIFMKGRERWISFDPREGGFGKNPAQLPDQLFPDPAQEPLFLAGVMAQIKAAINREALQEQKKMAENEEWYVAIREMETLESCNRMLAGVKKAPKQVQATFAKRAKHMGWIFSAEKQVYVPAPPEAA